ncbi:hypothetical protein CDAR_211421 [Caerostris darwini]|uniref:Uncharacterized protein n=1 Tax=Caerostris darwini TaxID=1538125 RepID=A0AAV4P3N0_9ARAC|nr:hypothetical protein CDAR_211421 [Caerostris darwini]
MIAAAASCTQNRTIHSHAHNDTTIHKQELPKLYHFKVTKRMQNSTNHRKTMAIIRSPGTRASSLNTKVLTSTPFCQSPSDKKIFTTLPHLFFLKVRIFFVQKQKALTLETVYNAQ